MRRLLSLSLMLAAAAAAQDNIVIVQRVEPQGAGAGIAVARPGITAAPFPGQRIAAGFEFIGAEMAVNPVVGAPYSAQAVTETNQVLADGNRIQRKVTSAVYRDSEGRTRREQSLAGFGPLAPPQDRQIIFITDPVAGTSYVLEPETKIARKSITPTAAELRRRLEEARQAIGHEGDAQAAVQLRRRIEAARQSAGAGGAAQPGGIVHEETNAVPMPPHAAVRAQTFRTLLPPSARTESLGRQWIEGVEAEGNRAVTTIPAGQIGNERPIEIVHEHWFSPELKITVMSRTVDPRMGETVYRLTGINRSEPPRHLFEVPPDYTVQ